MMMVMASTGTMTLLLITRMFVVILRQQSTHRAIWQSSRLAPARKKAASRNRSRAIMVGLPPSRMSVPGSSRIPQAQLSTLTAASPCHVSRDRHSLGSRPTLTETNQSYSEPEMQERFLHRHQAYLRPLEATISVSRATFSGLALRSWYALQWFGSAAGMCARLQVDLVGSQTIP